MTKNAKKSRNGAQYRGDKSGKSSQSGKSNPSGGSNTFRKSGRPDGGRAQAKNPQGKDFQGKNFKDKDFKDSKGRGDKPSAARKPSAGASGRAPDASITGAGERPNLFGAHAVREAWLNPERDIRKLYITAEALQGFAATIKDAAQSGLKRPPVTIVDKQTLDKMLQGEKVHQGVAIATSDVPEAFLSDIIIAEQGKTDSLILILDQVTDPHNVGAILRSASAFGAAGVIMQRKHAPALSGVLAKTACGAVDHIRTVYETNLSRAIESLQEAGYFVYGLDERGAENIMDIKRGGRVVLVLGAEGAGLRRLVAEHCDALLRLPTGGAIASLNVSNAAAVALYALIKH